MNLKPVTRCLIAMAALGAGLGVAERAIAHADTAARAAAEPNPFAAETLPIPAPEPDTLKDWRNR